LFDVKLPDDDLKDWNMLEYS